MIRTLLKLASNLFAHLRGQETQVDLTNSFNTINILPMICSWKKNSFQFR